MLPFLKLNPKSQTTMDDIIDILVFFMAISQVKKNRNPPSFTNKHKSSTKEEKKMKQAQKLNKRGEENETSTKAQQKRRRK